jgi:hypothetical protein
MLVITAPALISAMRRFGQLPAPPATQTWAPSTVTAVGATVPLIAMAACCGLASWQDHAIVWLGPAFRHYPDRRFVDQPDFFPGEADRAFLHPAATAQVLAQ